MVTKLMLVLYKVDCFFKTICVDQDLEHETFVHMSFSPNFLNVSREDSFHVDFKVIPHLCLSVVYTYVKWLFTDLFINILWFMNISIFNIMFICGIHVTINRNAYSHELF